MSTTTYSVNPPTTIGVNGSWRDDAINRQINNSQAQANLSSINGGRKTRKGAFRYKIKKLKGGKVEIALVPSPIKSVEGAGGTTNDVTTGSISTSLQNQSNAKFDSSVSPVSSAQKGGTNHNPISPNTTWPCYSGGKYSSKKSRKSKKSKKSRKSKKSKKSKKSRK